MAGSAVEVRPILAADLEPVGRFLHQHLNRNVSAEAWASVVAPPWEDSAPNHGFQLVGDEGVVGVYAAVYSLRDVGDEQVRVCNLAAFCVLEDHRVHGLRLVRALLSQQGYEFTDLSPSGNVVALNERLGFRRLDTSTKLVPNLPWVPRRGTRVTSDPEAIHRVLRGRDAEIYRDHRRAPAAQHLLVTHADEHGYLMYRRDARKGVRTFASPLYAGGDPGCLEAAWPSVGAHLLRRGLVATLAERRVLGFAPRPGIELPRPRPKMFRGSRLEADTVDYLYSELTLVPW
ncbi:hypothetical protein [Agromyces cerinus]|uniref:N-acetyltransferase domain-containing protein n=1 Tax=Agromyces cerinus subsp. cerinus TaxID=232089 RepID=A0A1N6F699_9MICO|nr:hypothetical protein [Agromyces cerinus]SIN90780.1 hypothetical protein SAMN05443544_1781 [Agromyces cerinus subsp. cerinus]